jgi:(p)ppGpp synthase/HD superfamily hydrolase
MGDPVRLTERFDRALLYACQVHGGHTRKQTTIPYVAHLLAVASLVLEDGGDEDQAIAAPLHDAPEDQGGRGRLADIEARFGERVTAIVEACSDTFERPKPAFIPRKRAHLRRLRSVDAAVLRVSAADKLNNARAILADLRRLGDALFARFNGGKSGTLWYYACVTNVLRERLPGALTDELERVVRDIRQLAAPDLPWATSEDEDPP